VFLSLDSKTGEKVAIKKMPINKKNKIEHLITEICIMKTSVHPNIVRYIDSYRVDQVIWVCRAEKQILRNLLFVFFCFC